MAFCEGSRVEQGLHEIDDLAGNVGMESGVTNRVNSDQGALFLYLQGTLDGLAFDRVVRQNKQLYL
jgi:hypothetical protein